MLGLVYWKSGLGVKVCAEFKAQGSGLRAGHKVQGENLQGTRCISGVLEVFGCLLFCIKK